MKAFIMMAAALFAVCLDTNAEETADSVITKEGQLGEVVVKGRLPKTRVVGGAMITRIAGSVLAEQGSAEDMLAKVPGMTRNGDALEVIGKGSPIIYINGRLMRDADELKHLRSEEVRDVEVINNPGAEYDATVRAVVRIRTLKAKGDGFGFDYSANFNQSLRYGYGRPTTQLKANYRHGGVDVFGSASYWSFVSGQYSTLDESWATSQHTMSQGGPYNTTWNQHGMRYNVGGNWQISDNHSVGIRLDLNHKSKNHYISSWETDITVDGKYDDHLNSCQTADDDNPVNSLLNAYYNGRVGNLGIDLNLDYLHKGEKTDKISEEKSEKYNETIDIGADDRNSMFATKLILTHPLLGGKLKAGVDMAFLSRTTENTISKTSYPNSKAHINDNTIAAFVEYSHRLWTGAALSAGLRYEHNSYKYDDMIGNDDLNRTCDDFFPSVALSSRIGNVQTSLNYSVKTERPSFWALSDAINYVNRFTVQTGDPRLKNSIIHDLGMNISWKWLTFTTSYMIEKNAITQWSLLNDDESIVLMKHINLDDNYKVLSASVNVMPTFGIWTPNFSLGVDKPWLKIAIDYPDGIRETTFNRPVWSTSFFNTFRLKGGWQMDVEFSMRGKGHQQNFERVATSSVFNAYLQKNFTFRSSQNASGNMLTLRLGVTDIFQGWKAEDYGDMGFYKILQCNRRNRHNLTFSPLYRFNAAKSKYKGTGAGKETQQRVGGV